MEISIACNIFLIRLFLNNICCLLFSKQSFLKRSRINITMISFQNNNNIKINYNLSTSGSNFQFWTLDNWRGWLQIWPSATRAFIETDAPTHRPPMQIRLICKWKKFTISGGYTKFHILNCIQNVRSFKLKWCDIDELIIWHIFVIKINAGKFTIIN